MSDHFTAKDGAYSHGMPQSASLEANPKMPSMAPPPLQLMTSGESEEGQAFEETTSASAGRGVAGTNSEGNGNDSSKPDAAETKGSGKGNKVPILDDYKDSALRYGKPFEHNAFMESDVVGKWNVGSYWWNKFGDEFTTAFGASEFARFENHDERDAILSEILRQKPTNIAAGLAPPPVQKYISMNITKADPADASKRVPIRVFYKIVYENKPKAGSSDPLHEVDITFLEEETAPQAPTDVAVSESKSVEVDKSILSGLDTSKNDGSFPDGSAKAYFAKEAGVKQQVGDHLQKLYTAHLEGKDELKSINQTLKVKDSVGNTPEIRLKAVFSKTDGVSGIESFYLAAPAINIKEEVLSKDNVDLEIETFYKANPLSNRKMGVVNGLDSLPKEEQLIAKHCAYGLFTYDKFKDTEVDQVVPIKDKANPSVVRDHYYTFAIHPEDANHVVDFTVRRIGVKGVDFADPNVATISGAYGYKADFTVDQLKAWLLQRYPTVHAVVKGMTDKAGILAKANEIVDAECSKTDWYKKNYGVSPLTAVEALAVLSKTEAAWAPEQRLGLKDFDPVELKSIELTLQKLSSGLIGLLKGMRVIRQIDILSKKGEAASTAAGITLTGRKIIIMDDSAFKAVGTQDATFFGGTEGVHSHETRVPSHEFGHEIGNSASKVLAGKTKQDMYNAFLDSIKTDFGYGTVGVTDYARKQNGKISSPKSEMFPEAMMLYLQDPEWLRTNRPPEFFWFDYLNKNGVDPAYGKIKAQVKTLIDKLNAQKLSPPVAGN